MFSLFHLKAKNEEKLQKQIFKSKTVFVIFEKSVRCFENLHASHEQVLVQLGSVFPHSGAVYLCCWCAMFERDGSGLMLC